MSTICKVLRTGLKADDSADCLRQAIQGDRVSTEELVGCWYARVFAFCQSKLRSPADAEDATQETFARGLARLDQVNSPQAIGGWFRGIANNVCVDLIRRSVKRESPSLAVEETIAADEVDAAQKDEQDFLVGLVHELPEPLREAVLLHYYDQMTYDEIADWLGCARSTVNERLSKSRGLLRKKLLAREFNDEV